VSAETGFATETQRHSGSTATTARRAQASTCAGPTVVSVCVATSLWPIRFCALLLLGVLVGCRQSAQHATPLVAQLTGTFEIGGLSAPVRIVRDRWGVPHIYAASRDDLFVAQGFVQAQDRLFQMDLWRRSAQGRLSEVLGANFIERDAMTRRMQYRGDLDAEWASYGSDARAIASAFVRGINAWVALARERPPEEFVAAGWKPAFWVATDLLNRTDAFIESGDAIEEVRRRHFSEVIADALRRVGAKPYLAGLPGPVWSEGTPVSDERRANFDAVRANTEQVRQSVAANAVAGSIGRASVRDGIVTVSEAQPELSAPSPRYLVHLQAPGWNVIGATAPWRPGVAFGHNDRIAWGMTSIDVDTQDIEPMPVDGTPRTTVTDAIVVKGRRVPFTFETEITAGGIVIASDREHGRVFAIRWSGTETGAAPELGAFTLDVAEDAAGFRRSLARWNMPARRVVFADRDGTVGFQDAALVPIRRAGSGGSQWREWFEMDDLPHAFNPPRGVEAMSAKRNGAAVGPQAEFVHVLAITPAAQRRYNVGPIDRPTADDSPVRLTIELHDWDASRAINAPGQSGSPSSPHVRDLAALWSHNESFPLLFRDASIAANASATLTLVPTSAARSP
jgi:penicillin amidase